MSGRLETRDRQLPKDRVQFGNNRHNGCYCQIIVRYMGTIAMPKDTRVWEHRIQSVHNAIKRLTDSRSTHTLVRLNLNADGIRLYNSSGKVLMHHSKDGVASFGLCPADDMLFCLVTFDEENKGAGPSCQIFRVDPYLASHKDHFETAEKFGVRCEISVDRDYCVEFPTSAHSAVELFKRFYTETLTMFNFSRDSLDVAMFIPPGFESQFNISGTSNDSDFDQSEMNSSTACIVEVKSGGSDNVRSRSDPSKKSVLDLSTIKPLRELENIPADLERTTIFPADVSLQDLDDLNDTLKCNQSYNNENNCESVGSLDVGMVDDQYNSDQELTDSPNGAENLRSQVKKFLQHCSEPSSNRLHIQRFSADETFHLGPESPLPSVPSRLKKPGTQVGHESRLAREQVMSQKTSTPSHIQKTAVRSQSTIINQIAARRTSQAKKLVATSNGKVTLRAKQLDTENDTRDHLSYFSPIVNLRSKSAYVERENTTFDKGLILKDTPRRAENFANLSVYLSSPPWNLSFHGSLESVFSDDSDQSGQTKFCGSCRELAPNCPETVGRAASWAVGFENLLNDSDGVAIFLQHLKNEFSQENMNFWLKCKEYQALLEEERKIEAEKIFQNYLDPFGNECVNVDQTTVVAVKKSLHLAPVDLFDEAQKHIFKLMKEDSYSRFKTSQLYKDAVVAEMEGLPFASEQKCPDVEKNSEKIIARSKSIKSKDDKRRLSLGFFQKKEKEKTSGTHELLKNSQTRKVVDNEKSEPSVVNICVTLPDGSITNVKGRWGQKISQVLLQLGDKLKSGLNFIEVIDQSTQLVLDVTKDVKTLSCKAVHLKNCALFRLTLPSEKSLAIRGRSGETVNETLGPILKKYGLTLDKVVMHITGTGVILKDEMLVDSLNCCHVLVESLYDSKGKKKGGTIGRKSGMVRQMMTSSQPINRLNHISDFEVQMRLEEVFRDVFDGKVDFSFVHFDELGIFNLEKLGKLNGRRSSSRFNLFTPRATADKARPKVDFSKKPPARRIEAPDDKFLNLLMSAQSRQMDSQRGMLKKEDLQMPDFLKENCDTAPSFQALNVTSTPSRSLSLNNNVENTSKNSWSHNIRVTNSLTSMEERSQSSSESTSTDHEWNIENDPVFATLDHRSTSDTVHGLSRTERQSNDIVSNNVQYNIDVHCNGIAGANKTSMQRTVQGNFSSKFAAAKGAFEPRAAASTFKTDNNSSVKSFKSSYV